MITADSPLIGKPSGTLDAALDYAGTDNAEYVKEVWRLGLMTRLDPALIVAQACHETADFTSPRWVKNRNPAGLGIEADSDKDPATLTQTEAATTHVGTLLMAAIDSPIMDIAMPTMAQAWRQRWYDKITDPYFPQNVIRTVADLQKRYVDSSGEPQAVWAWDDRYAAKLIAKHRAIFGTDAATTVQSEGANAQMSRPRIILNPGHRNSTGGNHEEAEWTPYLATAYFDAFSAAGYEVINLGDTNGGLDETSRRIAAAIQSAPGECIVFDLHYEGSPVPGVFVIIPDVTGLTTGAPVQQSPLDTWENNAKDREVGKAVAVRIGQNTGLSLRTSGVREPGLMDESQTGVGYQGYRLATFAYTSPYHVKAVRLVVEHGNHTVNPDRAIMLRMGPTTGFPKACAAAAVEAVNSIYGKPDTTPHPSPIWWEPGEDVGIVTRASDGYKANAMLVQTYATTKRDVPVYDQIGGKKIAEVAAGKPAIIGGTTRAKDAKATGWYFVKVDGGWGRARGSSFLDKLPMP